MKNIFYIGILVLPSALANTNPLGVEPKLSSLDINDFELFSLKTGMTLEDFDAVFIKNIKKNFVHYILNYIDHQHSQISDLNMNNSMQILSFDYLLNEHHNQLLH